MNESIPSRPFESGLSMSLPLRDAALLTLAMGLVALVSFGLGYVTGRDEAAGFVHRPNQGRGIDTTLADDALVDLLARIEVSNAADKGVSELRFPDELRGRPQDRPLTVRERWAIDLGAVTGRRLDDLQTVLKGRGIHADLVGEAEPHLVVGMFADPSEAASWLPLLEEGLSGLGLDRPRVVPDPRRDDASAEE